jgi:hypothetical protein
MRNSGVHLNAGRASSTRSSPLGHSSRHTRLGRLAAWSGISRSVGPGMGDRRAASGVMKTDRRRLRKLRIPEECMSYIRIVLRVQKVCC